MARVSSRYCPPIEASLQSIGGAPIRSSYSGEVVATPRSPDSDFPGTILVDRLWSGIRLEWSTDDLGFNDIRIVRKQRDYAYNVNDGLTVYEGPASSGSYDDITVTGPEVFYYVLWFRDNPTDIWETRFWTKIWEIALGPNTMPELLWRLLPSMYHRAVEIRDNSSDLNLQIHHVIAPVLREIESLTEFLPKVLDVDETPGPYLKAIAQYVGLEPNLELTYIQQREEIKAAVSSFKSKGRLSTLERMARSIAGVLVTVVDYNQYILFRDWPGKIRPNLDDPSQGYYFMMPQDITYKRPIIGSRGYHDFATYGVYLQPEANQRIDARTVAKLHRSLRDFSPCYFSMTLWAISATSEVYDVSSRVIETYHTAGEAHFPTETIDLSLLYRDTLAMTRDDVNFLRLRDWPAESSWIV